jgi:hypothetical protein
MSIISMLVIMEDIDSLSVEQKNALLGLQTIWAVRHIRGDSLRAQSKIDPSTNIIGYL